MKSNRLRATALRMSDAKLAEDMPRVSVVFDRRRKATDCCAATVEVMVYQPRERVRKYISTGVRVFAHQWSDTYWVVGRSDAAQLNSEIRKQYQACVDALAVSPTLNQDMKVERDGDAGFLDWLHDRIDKCKLADGTKKHHWVMYRNLEAWGGIRRFRDVTPARLKEYVLYVEGLTVTHCEGDNAVCVPIDQQTVYNYWKRLRKWINVAIEERKVPMDCMLGVHVSKGQSREREFLTDGEIEILRSAIVPKGHLSDTRDRALVQMGCGLAFADLMSFDLTRHMKMGDYETVQGRRSKTGQQFFVVFMPWAVPILERWEWNVPAISNDKYNQYLGELCELVGIDKHVTSHVLRHTYACYCLRHGVRIEAVSRALGHRKISTTQIYARLVDNDVVEAFGKMK